MKTLAEFTKTTLIGGILVILPIYIAVLLLAKTVKGLLALLVISAATPTAVRSPHAIARRASAWRPPRLPDKRSYSGGSRVPSLRGRSGR